MAGGGHAISVPTPVEAGLVEIAFRNAGRVPHQAQLLKVEGRRSIEEILRAIDEAGQGGQVAPWLRAAGGVGLTPAGRTRRTTQRLEPGKYVVADLGSPERGAGTPFYRSGAVAALEVTGKGDGGALPGADARVTARDYSFTSSGLEPGRTRIEFENAGKEPHHLVAARMRPGRTIEDVRRFFANGRGRSPLVAAAPPGTAIIEGGERQVTELELGRGRYALLCFVADREGGPPHVSKGMVAEARVE